MLSPKYGASHVYGKAIKNNNSVQLFLDYDCPFSAKIFSKIHKEVIPQVEKKHPGKFSFVVMNVIQPWHPTSTLMHEVALAVAKVHPDRFWDYSQYLFDNQSKFFDTETLNETRVDTIARLVDLACDLIGKETHESEIRSLVHIDTSSRPSNAGNKIAASVKYFTKYARGLGVHVTPTVFVNGVVSPSIESSTPSERIVEILEGEL